MDYVSILQRSFHITLRHRRLWLFGFLLAIFGVGSSAGNGIQYIFQAPLTFPPAGIPQRLFLLLMIGLVFIAIALAIIATVINYVCQTALIGMVREIEVGQEPTICHGFDIGWSRSALRLFGADLVIYLPVTVIVGALAAVLVFGVGYITSQSRVPGGWPFLLLCCLAILVPAFIALIIALGVLQNFFYRRIALEGEGVFEGISHGYRLVRRNLGPVAAVWLIMLVIGLTWAIVNFVLGLIAFALVGGPAALIYGLVRSGIAAALAALPFALVTIAIFAAINALYVVFTSTVWTLTYLALPEPPGY